MTGKMMGGGQTMEDGATCISSQDQVLLKQMKKKLKKNWMEKQL